MRTALAACGAPPPEPAPARIPEPANPPADPRCAAITDGIAVSSSTPTNPNIIRGFMILSAAPCSYDAANRASVADTLPPTGDNPPGELFLPCRCLMGMARLRWPEKGLRPSVTARRRTSKRRSAYYCWLDVSALLAVFLVIFVSLAVTPENVCSRAPGADLAKSQHCRRKSGALREDAMQLIVTRDGKLYFGREKINPGELPDQLRADVRAGAENRVYLLVDSRIKYADVKPVLNEIGAAGVKNISFLMRSAPAEGANP